MDSNPSSSTNDQKANSSETGPGVDIYAAGTNIMSSTSTTNKWGSGSQNYYLNSSYKQTNISGTSMATPQVVGIGACLLELYPNWSPAKLKQYLLDNITEHEIIEYCKLVNIPITNSKKHKLIEQIESAYPGSKFALAKSFKNIK